jgi:hypothetical protein
MKYLERESQNAIEQMYYLLPPAEPTIEGEVKQLILHVFNRVDTEHSGRGVYHFDIHKFLKVQGVTGAIKAKILNSLDNVLSWYPPEKRNKHISMIRDCITTFATPEVIEVDQDLDQLMKEVFNLTDFELSQLKGNLSGENNTVFFTYTGYKIKLWKILGELRASGIDRILIAKVFSQYCVWRKSSVSETKGLDYKEIIRKIDKSGINQG